MNIALSELNGSPTSLRPTREMAYQRTVELALLAGRKAHQIRQSDYEQAKRELTGETDSERQQASFNDEYFTH